LAGSLTDRAGSQQAEGWVIVVQDITVLQQAERARINFIHDAAHDLRNPLGVTLHVLEVLQTESNPSPEHGEMIVLGLKGLKIEQNAREILKNLGTLSTEMSKFREDFEVTGSHLFNACKKYEDSSRRLGRFSDKLQNIQNVNEIEAPEKS
jgi:signal transduction histidine kinase